VLQKDLTDLFAVLFFVNYSEIQALEIGQVFLKHPIICNLQFETLGIKI
jgi:hypothetical protein